MKLKYQLQHRMENSNYLMHHILYQILRIILDISKNHGEKTDNPAMRKQVIKWKIELHLK